MIDPSTLKLKSLPWVPLDAVSCLPESAGIYFVVDLSKRVQYIGQSKNVRKRWRKHLHFKRLAKTKGVKIAYLLLQDVELLTEVESAMIRYFDPPLNLTRPGYKRVNVTLDAETFEWLRTQVNQGASRTAIANKALYQFRKKWAWLYS